MEKFPNNLPENKENSASKKISRRTFLKKTGEAGLGLASAYYLGKASDVLASTRSRGEKQQEKKEKLEVSFEFIFGSHAKAADAQKIGEKIDEATCFCPEGLGWKEETLDEYNDISFGRKTPEDFLKKRGATPEQVKDSLMGSFNYALLKSIHNTKTPIFFVDIPRGSRLYEDSFKYGGTPSNVVTSTSFSSNFEKILNSFEEKINNLAQAEKEREQIIIKNLEKLSEFFKNNPDKLRKKNGGYNVKILVFLGALHTGVYQGTRKDDFKADISFNEGDSFVFDNFHEAHRLKRFSKEVDEELLARALAEQIFSSGFLDYKLRKVTSDEKKKMIFKRKFFARLSFQEIKEIFESADPENKYEGKQIYRLPLDFYNFVIDEIEKKLKEKGFKLPRTLEEFENILNS